MSLEQGGFERVDVGVTDSEGLGLQFAPNGVVQRVQVGAVGGPFGRREEVGKMQAVPILRAF